MLYEFFRSRFSGNRKTQLSLVGGKGLNLGELSNIQGIQVPEGFCVTTVGYEKAIEQNEELQTLLQQLTKLKKEDRAQIGEISKKIREVIMAVEIPSDVVEAVTHYLSRFEMNMRMPCALVRRLKIYRMLHLLVNKIRI